MGMNYIELEEYRNQYPSDLKTSISKVREGFFTHKGTSRTNQEAPKNQLEYPIIDTGNINFIPDSELFPETNKKLNINFIIDFNGELWTSETFFGLLRKAMDEENPFFNKDTVPTVKLNLEELSNYSKLDKFNVLEKYAEVNVTSTIDTIRDMLLHIDWLVAPSNVLDELRDLSDMGSWVKITSPDKLGVAYIDEVRKIIKEV